MQIENLHSSLLHTNTHEFNHDKLQYIPKQYIDKNGVKDKRDKKKKMNESILILLNVNNILERIHVLKLLCRLILLKISS